jgi:hypothetical protein
MSLVPRKGTYTSISMLIAEELEVDLSQVQYEHAPPNDKLYANPLIGFQMTGGSTAMYAPWDRLGLQAHPEWAQTYRLQAWNPTRDLSFILENVHEVPNSDQYLGI